MWWCAMPQAQSCAFPRSGPARKPGRCVIRLCSRAGTPGGRSAPTPPTPGCTDCRVAWKRRPYTGSNPLFQHGPLRVAASHRTFEHADGSPFFWLADTWWMGFVKRLSWPEDFQVLTADRVRKGFSVVQIVAGLYPDMPERHPLGANEAGFPYDEGYQHINPAYFDMADLRIRHLAENGIAPCVVGCWGYYLPILGVEKLKRHWRYLVARWGAYPAFWCLAGEGTMPYYLSKTPEHDAALQKAGWTEVARYVRGLSPYRNPITIHPSSSARATLEDASGAGFRHAADRPLGPGEPAQHGAARHCILRGHSRDAGDQRRGLL